VLQLFIHLGYLMPRKIRQLLADLRRAGFREVTGGKGSHRKWRHPITNVTAVVSGADGDDAKPYQEREVRSAILDSRRGLDSTDSEIRSDS
jgi:predicted RNA binding protein YcfA (HicA-like mRNA interferase family)